MLLTTAGPMIPGPLRLYYPNGEQMELAAETVFKCEEFRAQPGKRFSQFRQLLSGAVDLETRKFRDRERLLEKCVDVPQVSE
jgi:hypothetical protein